MSGGVVSVGVLADFADLIEQSDAAGLSIEAFAGKTVTSARTASRAMADFAKSQGASADEAKAAAAQTAAAWDATYGTLSKGAKDAGNAALATSRLFKESADQQSAAFAQAAAAAQESEAKQKAAADGVAAAQRQVVAAAKAAADAQAAAAAKADLLTAKLGGIGEHTAGVAKEISKLGGIGFAASIAGMGDLAAKYQQATQQIAANSDISSAAAAKIGKAFLGTSGTTIYSAKEMTEAFAPVSGQLKAVEGQALNSGQALKVMAAAGDLAEATSSTLTDSTAALSTVMQGYHLPVSQAAQATDLLFNTSRALNQPLDTIAQAINRLHGRLGDLAPTLGDVGGLMVELGSHGVQGSRGVSVVNTALQTLVGQSQPVTEMLDALGVKIFNAQGKFVGLQSVIGQLQPKMSQLTQQNQDLAAKTLFGSSAAQVMLSIVQRGPQAFDQATGAAQKLGTAHRAAEEQSKTLTKQLDILKATVENDATSIGLKLIPELTNMAKGLESGINWLEKHKTASEDLAKVIAGVLGLAVTVFAYQKATAFVTATGDMLAGVGKLAGGLAGVPAKLTGIAGGVSAFGDASAAAAPEVAALDTAALGLTAALGPLAIAIGAVAAGAATLKAAGGINGIWGGGGPTTVKGVEQQYGMPKTGETERKYIASTIGIPPNFKSGEPLTAKSYLAASSDKDPADQKQVKQFFAWLNSAGHFGHHGFTRETGTPIDAAPGAGTLKGGGASLLTSKQQQFASYMAGDTGMNPNLISAWMLAEQSGSAAKYYQGENNNDWLNIGVTGAPGSANFYKTHDAQAWTNPQTAAAATTAWLTGQDKSMGGYGAASGGIQSAFLGMRNASPAQQVSLLQNSGWASGGYPSLMSDYDEVVRAGGVQTGVGARGGISALSPLVTVPGSSKSSRSSSSSHSAGGLNAAIGNIGTGGSLPAVLQASGAASQATALQDQTTRVQAIGQAQVTVLQAVNQQLQDQGARVVQKLSDLQALISDRAAAVVTAMKDSTQAASDKSAEIVTALKDSTQHASDKSAEQVTAMKNAQQAGADSSAEQVTALKDQQAVTDEKSAIQVAAITAQTQVIQDTSALNVAAIQDAATRVSDADNAAATLVSDNAQTNADTINERGLYGLNLVAQKLQVVADQVKAGFDIQIAAAQAQLDTDQSAANVANDQAQLNTDQVTATQNLLVMQAQQNLNMVTMKQDALEAKAQQHLDTVTATQDTKESIAQLHLDSVTAKEDMRESIAQLHLDAITSKEDALEAAAKLHVDSVTMTQDAKAAAAKAHSDAIAITQDSLILKATQHADAVQLSVDTTKIGPAQTAVDMNAGASKTIQTEMQNQLSLATAQGNVSINAAQLQLAGVTSSANNVIANAQNAYQQAQNSANTAIQGATDQYTNTQNAANLAIQQATGQYDSTQNAANKAIQTATGAYTSAQDTANAAIQNATGQYTSAQNTANKAIQTATDTYNNAQDTANKQIGIATQTAASTLAGWALKLAGDQGTLTTTQGSAALGEATASGNVTGEQALASTQFAGSGLTINQYGVDLSNPTAMTDAASWAIRTSSIATG